MHGIYLDFNFLYRLQFIQLTRFGDGLRFNIWILKNLVNKGMWYEQYETVNILVLHWSKLIIAQSQTEIVIGIFTK